MCVCVCSFCLGNYYYIIIVEVISMPPPTIDVVALCFQEVCPSVRSLHVRQLTNILPDAISLYNSGRISTKLGTNIRHEWELMKRVFSVKVMIR